MAYAERVRNRVQLVCSDVSLTKQGFKDQCDMNGIVERARTTGMLTHVNARSPMYGDVSNVSDYKDALLVVNRANECFMALPSKVRERFSNDPNRMVEFLSNPANFDEAVSLGLIEPKKPAEGDKPVVSDPGAPGDASIEPPMEGTTPPAKRGKVGGSK